MAGPSGFMLLGTSDHGALLRLVGRPRKAVQYVVGNPLFAVEMTEAFNFIRPSSIANSGPFRRKSCVSKE